MSLPPLYTRTRVSISLHRPQNLPSINGSCSILSPNPIIPILKKDKNLKPELIVSKVLDHKFSASPSLEHLKISKPKLCPISQVPSISPKAKKSSYLKKNFVAYIHDNRFSEITSNYTKPIRDYFNSSPPLHKSFMENLEKIVEKPKIDPKIERKLTPINSVKPEFMPLDPANSNKGTKRKVVHTKRHVPEAKSSFKKGKIEVSFSKYINESLQTDWNSFVLDEWELDPYA